MANQSPGSEGARPPSTAVPSIVHDVLRSPGRALDTVTRASMERRLSRHLRPSSAPSVTSVAKAPELTIGEPGDLSEQEADAVAMRATRTPRKGDERTPGASFDFSSIRVHTDAPAATSARAVDALAYTVGQHVVFAAGAYAPGTPAGEYLLAHELVHTVQQRSSPNTAVLRRAGAGGCARAAETVDEQRDELAFAGRTAHAQIQGFYAVSLQSEVPLPRATKDQRSLSCPPSGTPNGRVDLWKSTMGLNTGDVLIGEIKSIQGKKFAKPDVDHYRTRFAEMSGRFGAGTPCPGPTDAADDAFDQGWLGGALKRGKVLTARPLDSIVPLEPDTEDLGPFWGDPLEKDLRCQRPAGDGGAVVYWCTLRDLSEEEKKAERVRLAIPVGESGRRTQTQTGKKAPALDFIDPDLYEYWKIVAGTPVPAGRIYNMAVPEPFFQELVGNRQLQQTLRLMRVPVQQHPIFQFRTIVWGTLGVISAVALAAIVLAVGAALIPEGAAVAAAGAGTAGGTGTAGGVVIPLFGTATASAETFAKAAAVVFVVGSLTVDPSEAKAAESVKRAMANPKLPAFFDITDDPRALSGGDRYGSSVTIDGLPYRIIARFSTQ